nr:transporter substrate-binding domain-containing protein [Niveibacterium umoris]
MPITHLGYAAYRDAQGNLAGYMIDEMRELARRSGCVIEAADYPVERIRVMSTKGQVSVKGFTSLDGPVAPPMYWVPTLQQDVRLLVRRDRAPADPSFDAAMRAPGLVIGVVRGLYYGDAFDALFDALPEARKDISATMDDLLRKLAAGRIDASPLLPVEYVKWLRDQHLEHQFISLPFSRDGTLTTGWKFFSPPIAPGDLKLLIRAAESMRDDGTDLKLIMHYLGPDEARTTVRIAPPR